MQDQGCAHGRMYLRWLVLCVAGISCTVVAFSSSPSALPLFLNGGQLLRLQEITKGMSVTQSGARRCRGSKLASILLCR